MGKQERYQIIARNQQTGTSPNNTKSKVTGPAVKEQAAP